MKYLLKQNKEDKGVLCDKVIVGMFDYYLDANDPDFRYVATNDPNIDIPKVVDEVEDLDILKSKWYDNQEEDRSEAFVFQYSGIVDDALEKGIIIGYNKSQETHPFSEDDMIEFAVWKEENRFSVISTKEHWVSELLNYSGCVYTSKELLQLWKEQQPKIIYYEN